MAHDTANERAAVEGSHVTDDRRSFAESDRTPRRDGGR